MRITLPWISRFLVVSVLAGAVLAGAPAAQASITNTRVDPPGTVELAGSSWLGGGGVNVYSNGSSAGSTWGNSYVNGVLAGWKWQCVELINRLYLTRGWTTTRWTGNANQMFGTAPATLAKQGNGAITYINPGDVVVLDGGPLIDGKVYGHVGVVNTVSANANGTKSVQIVNQNTTAVYSSATLTGGTLAMSGWASYSVKGVVHAPGGGGGGGGGVGEGSFIRTPDLRVYRIAGGAPMYVDSWTPYGGSQPFVDVPSLGGYAAFPADGTYISDLSDGRVYRVAGGAPTYVSYADASAGRMPGWGKQPIIQLTHWEFTNYQHLRRYPANGTFVRNVVDGRCYRIAGGSPMYIASTDASKVPGWGTKPLIDISSWELDNYSHLRRTPSDGTYISNVIDGRVYRVAGGSPQYISAADAAKLPGWGTAGLITESSSWEFANYQHLNRYPDPGTFVSNVADGKVYRMAGGAPFAVTDGAVLPGWGTPVTVLSYYEFETREHMRTRPARGTRLLGVPSGRQWVMRGKCRVGARVARNSAIGLNDATIKTIPVCR